MQVRVSRQMGYDHNTAEPYVGDLVTVVPPGPEEYFTAKAIAGEIERSMYLTVFACDEDKPLGHFGVTLGELLPETETERDVLRDAWKIIAGR